MTNVETNLLGKRVTAWVWLNSFADDHPQELVTGVVRAVAFGETWNFMIERDGPPRNGMPVGDLVTVSITDGRFISSSAGASSATTSTRPGSNGGRAHGEPRKLGRRRVSLPLFSDEDPARQK